MTVAAVLVVMAVPAALAVFAVLAVLAVFTVLAVLTVLIAVAMVGRFRMFSLKFKNFSLRDNFRRYILLLTAAAFIVMYGLAGFAWTIMFYFLLSVLSRRKI